MLTYAAMDILKDFLTPEQCHLITGYKRPGDQLRYFRSIGVTANLNAAKKVLVHRLAVEQALGAPTSRPRKKGPADRLRIQEVT